jgi:hypothetical protein
VGLIASGVRAAQARMRELGGLPIALDELALYRVRRLVGVRDAE